MHTLTHTYESLYASLYLFHLMFLTRRNTLMHAHLHPMYSTLGAEQPNLEISCSYLIVKALPPTIFRLSLVHESLFLTLNTQTAALTHSH